VLSRPLSQAARSIISLGSRFVNSYFYFFQVLFLSALPVDRLCPLLPFSGGGTSIYHRIEQNASTIFTFLKIFSVVLLLFPGQEGRMGMPAARIREF